MTKNIREDWRGIGEELEMVERKTIRGKKNKNDHRERRNRERKIRS